jgi:predicted RNA-binding protein YlxR (DUF448 family)
MKKPERTCVACRRKAEKSALVRVVRTADQRVSIDLGGKKPGRGAYLCSSVICLNRARRYRLLDRALRTTTGEQDWLDLVDVFDELCATS